VTKTSFALIPAIALAATLVVSGQGQAPAGGQAPPAPMSIKQVKPGLYMVTGFGGNSLVGTSREVKLGDVVVRAYHFANAHTGGDSVVLFPDLRVIAFGDEFVVQPPNADLPNGGSVLTFPKALEEALKLDWDTAIPGHGNDPMTRADVQAYQKKWAAIASKSLELRRKGVPKEQIRQQIQAELPEIAPWMMTGIVNDMRLDLFYAELTKAM